MMETQNRPNKTIRILVRVTPDFNEKIDEFISMSGYKNSSEFIRDAMLLKMHSDRTIESDYDKLTNFFNNRLEIFENRLEIFENRIKELLSESELAKPTIEKKKKEKTNKMRSLLVDLEK